jgi:endonuclease YncB( thermonuclease family)
VLPHSGGALIAAFGERPVFHRVALGCGLAALLAAGAQAAERPDCGLAGFGTAQVRSVIDGRTAKLDDGRELRLAGLEAPPLAEAAGGAAKSALVAGPEVSLLRLDHDSDRYGRVVAVVVARPAAESGIAASVQQALLAAGQTRVAAKIGDAACAHALQAAERAARAAGLGLWSDPHYLPRKAGDWPGILARGRFAVVEGKVESVRESGGTIYVNFSRRWSEDFTVTVLKRDEPSFTSTGLQLRNLAGRNVRVRGTVGERGGPWIEVTRPEQIEVAERQ